MRAELQALLALALLIPSKPPPSPAQLEERRDTELGGTLAPPAGQTWRDGDLADAARKVSDASTAGGQYPSRPIGAADRKNVIRGLTDEEKRRLLELLRMSAAQSVLICVIIF